MDEAEAARHWPLGLGMVESPMRVVAARLSPRLDEDAAALDQGQRFRIEAAVRGLERRGIVELGGWQRALRDIANPPAEDFVDWLSIERSDAHETDVGLHRHWVDPTRPFAEFVAKPAHGVLVTSATLTDGSGDPVGDCEAA